MSKKLIEIQSKITELIKDGTQVDKVIDKTTSELSTTEKIELKLLFEDAMRTHRMNAENWMQTDLTFPLSEILKSRLFVYPESSEQYYGYEPSPLEQKIQRWKELENEKINKNHINSTYLLFYHCSCNHC